MCIQKVNRQQLQLPTVKMVAARLSGGRFLQHIWQVQNHSIYKIICKVVGGKLQNGKDVCITNYAKGKSFRPVNSKVATMDASLSGWGAVLEGTTV